MIKKLSIFLCLILALSFLTSCGISPARVGTAPSAENAGAADPAAERADASEPAADDHAEGVRIVTTIFPIYDWVREIADGADAELTMLLDSGVDLHSYQPTVDDIVEVINSDLFIYVGGESDDWVEDALAETERTDLRVIDLMDALGDAVKEEEIVEGMDAGEDDSQGEDGDASGHEGNEIEYDEHVWLSLRNARTLCQVIAAALSEIDPTNSALYSANCEAYIVALADLDAAYQKAAANAAATTLLFGDRFPFRYLTDDYGLEYYAAFTGCSAESEASFETIVFLAEKADELGLKTILQIESADGSIARTIRDNTQTGDQIILTLDSMQSATAKDAAEGVTYLSVMRDNLEVLKTALGE